MFNSEKPNQTKHPGQSSLDICKLLDYQSLFNININKEITPSVRHTLYSLCFQTWMT